MPSLTTSISARPGAIRPARLLSSTPRTSDAEDCDCARHARKGSQDEGGQVEDEGADRWLRRKVQVTTQFVCHYYSGFWLAGDRPPSPPPPPRPPPHHPQAQEQLTTRRWPSPGRRRARRRPREPPTRWRGARSLARRTRSIPGTGSTEANLPRKCTK